MTDVTTIRRILYGDPVWAAYALADLQLGVAHLCRWRLGRSAAGEGLMMSYCGLTPPVLFTFGPPEAVAQALEEAERSGELPETAYMSIRMEHEPVVSHWYDYSADRRPMLRMVRRSLGQDDAPAVEGLVRLYQDDEQRLRALYDLGGAFAPDAFDPSQLEGGVFYGIETPDGSLLAAGGTHIVDWDAGIGAIGNFYTRPDMRRHGYAAALLAAIVRDLSAASIDTIVLNVDERNVNAGALYEKHGFAVHCLFIEGSAKRIASG